LMYGLKPVPFKLVRYCSHEQIRIRGAG